MKKILIIGAGVVGLSIATNYQNKKFRVIVLEKSKKMDQEILLKILKLFIQVFIIRKTLLKIFFVSKEKN